MLSAVLTTLKPASVAKNCLRRGVVFEALGRVRCSSTTNSSLPPSNDTSSIEVTKTKRSRRRFQRIDEVPSFRDFQHRQTVLALYRQFLQTVRPLSDRSELQAQIKKEFTAMKNETDAWNRKRAVDEGKRRLKDLQATVGLSFTSFGSNPTKQDDKEAASDEGSKVGSGWPWERS